MIETKYKPVSEGICNNYFTVLINKIYKILPLKEEHSPTVTDYIESLLREMTGNQEVILLIREDGRYMAVINTLEALRECHNVKVCKKEVFKCIRIIEDLNVKYFGGE